MPRIAGVDIPGKKRVESSLTYIYGIGWSRSHQILTEAGIDFATRTESLTEDQIARIRSVLEAKQKVEGELKRDIQQNINRLKELGCYRGLRHRKGLPVRGQRTKTNARTRKGPRRQPIAGKKAPGKK